MMSEEARELEAWIAGDDQLYRCFFVPVVRNLARRKFRNDYDSDKAIKAFVGVINEAARRYGSVMLGKRHIPDCFPRSLRGDIAVNMARDFEVEFDAGEYECYKQKYLR